MNERIRELFKTIRKSKHTSNLMSNPPQVRYSYTIDEEDIKKFAELIINECADLYTHDDVMAPVGQSAYGEAYQDGWIEGTKAYRETILDHFGISVKYKEKEWIDLTIEEREYIRDKYDTVSGIISAVSIMLWEKNS